MEKVPICASCIGMDFHNPVLSSDKKIPKWLENFNYVRDFITKKKQFKLQKKKGNDIFPISIQLPDKYKGKYVLYWASNPTKNELKIKGAKEAYGKFQNSGISCVSEKGILKIYIKCPQNYRTTVEGKDHEDTFYRHVHFLFQKNEKEWNPKKIYTKIVTCNVSKNELKNHILFNTLPEKEYNKEHIPNSFLLNVEMVKKMKRKDLHHYINELIKDYYPKIEKAVKNKDIEWYAVPIILYCKSSSCHASQKCLEELYKKGMVNIKIYKGGMKDYKKSS